jgi:hypothetical protein
LGEKTERHISLYIVTVEYKKNLNKRLPGLAFNLLSVFRQTEVSFFFKEPAVKAN